MSRVWTLDAPRGSVLSGSVWMLVASIVLVWVPFLGGLIAGAIGGRKSGSVSGAILAAILPSVVLSVSFYLFPSALAALPLFGEVMGAGRLGLALASIGPLLAGAVIGGFLS